MTLDSFRLQRESNINQVSHYLRLLREDEIVDHLR